MEAERNLSSIIYCNRLIKAPLIPAEPAHWVWNVNYKTSLSPVEAIYKL